MAEPRPRGELVARIVVLLILVAMFNNFRRGQLGPWLRAKLSNDGDHRDGALTIGSIFAGTSSSSTGGAITDVGSVVAGAAGGAASTGAADLVPIAGTRLSKRFAARMAPLIAAAAKDGITITGGGYRSYDEQFRLRGEHGCKGRELDPKCKCNPPTAVPGHSRHETGDAIDLHNAESFSDPVVVWMRRNAGRFGVYNLKGGREPWHWSIDGA